MAAGHQKPELENKKCFCTEISEIIFATVKNKLIQLLMFWFLFYSQSMFRTLLKVQKLFEVLNT